MKSHATPFFSYAKIVLILAMLSAGAWWYRNQGPRQAAAMAPSFLVVGTNVGYPPFVMTDEQGDIIGFDADIAIEIAHRLNRTVAFKDMAFEVLLLSLMQGSVDMVIGGMSITQERKKKGLLMPYHGERVKSVALFANGPLAVHSLADLAAAGTTVCTQAGSLFEELLEGYEGIRLKTLPDIVDIVLEIEHGRSEVAVLDVDTVSLLQQHHSWLQAREVLLQPHEQIEGYGIGIAQENDVLRKEVAAAIEAMKADGAFAKLKRKWFGPHKG
ncbi:MAG: transporter substrate-binding domain-containing protein [Candidatus Dependentiae bacterium]|jgi:ABC-type amino acid transport substrate-binding protein